MLGILLHMGTHDVVHFVPAANNEFGKRLGSQDADTNGTVMVLMYHHTGPTEKNMFRSYENFRHDLERLYEMNYRPVTVREYVENKMPLPPGASPVVFTFDDSHADQFHMLPDGSVDPHSFVGIWMEFAKSHPEFPVHCTFYPNVNGPWNQKEWLPKKLEMLKQWKCEIGNHTARHLNLKKLSDEQVKKEIAECSDMVEGLGFEPVSFCYPFGNMPTNMNIITKGFDYKGKTYKFSSATLAGDRPALPTSSPKWDRYKIARVQAYPGAEGIDWWLDKVGQGKSTPYVQR